MGLQSASLDRDLGDFFTQLDAMGIDDAVALTADHGDNDLPERQREQAMPMAERLAKSFNPATIGKAVGTTLGLSGKLLAYSRGNFSVTPDVPAAKKQAVIPETTQVLPAAPPVAEECTGAASAHPPPPPRLAP